ncbi:hypothetical protein [Natronococcus wangiae]|uniref:hypothetical protein n=1 Tax=Natronococcus wangiae TaxID=3068275 RepID=UPI00273F06C2|nr:hypothetical protein [Natronococcus sp. AD5]
MQNLLAFGRTVFDLEVGGIARVDPATDLYRIEAINGDRADLEPGTELALSDTYCRTVVDNASGDTVPKPTEISPAAGGLPEHPSADDHDVRTYLGTCIPIEGDLDRVFFFTSSDPSAGSFSERERTFLRLMGQWLKDELERRRHGRLLRDLYETTGDPQASFSAKVERLLELGCERFGLDMAGLNHLPAWDGAFKLETGIGLGVDPGEELWTDPSEGCFCRQTITADAPVEMTDASESGWADDRIHQQLGLTSYLGTKVRAARRRTERSGSVARSRASVRSRRPSARSSN